MKRQILLILVVTGNIIFPQVIKKEYPEWFLFPAKYKDVISSFGSNDSIGKINAAKMFASLKKSIAKGKLYLYQREQDDELYRLSDYYYYYDSSLAKEIEKRLKLVDKYIPDVLGGDYLFAFATSDSIAEKFHKVAVEDMEKPEWLEESENEDAIYYYGVGFFTSGGKESAGWVASLDNAIFNLLKGASTKIAAIRELEKINFAEKYSEIIGYKLHAELKNIEILERYFDFKHQLLYTRIRLKKSNLIIK